MLHYDYLMAMLQRVEPPDMPLKWIVERSLCAELTRIESPTREWIYNPEKQTLLRIPLEITENMHIDKERFLPLKFVSRDGLCVMLWIAGHFPRPVVMSVLVN